MEFTMNSQEQKIQQVLDAVTDSDSAVTLQQAKQFVDNSIKKENQLKLIRF